MLREYAGMCTAPETLMLIIAPAFPNVASLRSTVSTFALVQLQAPWQKNLCKCITTFCSTSSKLCLFPVWLCLASLAQQLSCSLSQLL